MVVGGLIKGGNDDISERKEKEKKKVLGKKGGIHVLLLCLDNIITSTGDIFSKSLPMYVV